MALDQTLRLLVKASGLSVGELAAAIPRAGAATVSAWLRGAAPLRRNTRRSAPSAAAGDVPVPISTSPSGEVTDARAAG